MRKMQKHKRVKIEKNRYLSYSEFGTPKGKPVLYFHGWPGFRLETEMIGETAAKFDLRLIAIDRPGYRNST